MPDPILLVHGGAWAILTTPSKPTPLACAARCLPAMHCWSAAALPSMRSRPRLLCSKTRGVRRRAGILSHARRPGAAGRAADGWRHHGSMRAGGVACVERLRNPIHAARLVLEKSPHVYFVGRDAENFAAENGMPLIDNTELVLDRERKRLMRRAAEGACRAAR